MGDGGWIMWALIYEFDLMKPRTWLVCIAMGVFAKHLGIEWAPDFGR